MHPAILDLLLILFTAAAPPGTLAQLAIHGNQCGTVAGPARPVLVRHDFIP